MVCAVCQGKMIEKNADLDLRIGGELYIAHNVPFEECTNCGERVIDPETSEVIYQRIHRKKYSKQRLEIPTLDLAVNM
jgi:YgiT-type zinc finger domain-containing protein